MSIYITLIFFFITSVFELFSYLRLSYSIFVFISCFLDLVFDYFCPINTSLVLFAFPFPKTSSNFVELSIQSSLYFDFHNIMIFTNFTKCAVTSADVCYMTIIAYHIGHIDCNSPPINHN